MCWLLYSFFLPNLKYIEYWCPTQHPFTAPPARRWPADPSAEPQLDSHPCAMLTSPKQNTQTLAGLSAIPNKKGVHRANTMTEWYWEPGGGGGEGVTEISSYPAASALELDFFGRRCEGGVVVGAHETLHWRSTFPRIYRNRCTDWMKLAEAMWGQHVGSSASGTQRCARWGVAALQQSWDQFSWSCSRWWRGQSVLYLFI